MSGLLCKPLLRLSAVLAILASLLAAGCVSLPDAGPSAPPASAGPVPLEEVLSALQPPEFWQIFYDLTQIPRPSGHVEQVRAFLVEFGEGLGLETSVDEAGNVLIRRPAAKGLENRKGVLLQSHMDMVAEKTPDAVHEFVTDPLDVYVEDGWVKANGTTLGADNGAGMAMAMAILQSKTLNAGPIEALFTVDEETTMSGAGGLKPGELQSEIYINLDAEIEGQFIISSAGGAAAGVQAAYREVSLPAGMAAYRFSVQGLAGGHSGLDIHLGRGHAGKLMVRWLREAAARYGLRVAEMASGTAGNAIPREATALVCVPQAQADAFLEGITDYEATLKAELAAVEPELSVGAVPAGLPALVMDEADQRRLLAALYATPQGVIRMSDAAPGLVETSTNMGIVRAQAGTLEVTNYMRSSLDSALDDLAGLVASVWELAGVPVAVSGRYVGWAPNPNSPILAVMQEVYEEEFGFPAEVAGVHAGTECGTIVVKYPQLDAVAIGPTIEDVHSPDEKMDVASVQKVVDLLAATLERSPEK